MGQARPGLRQKSRYIRANCIDIDKALLFDGRSIKKIVLYVKGKFATKCKKMLDAVPKITERMRRVDTGLEKFE